MATLGDTLRTARESRGASCSEAAAVTRIKVQHIEDLEANDFSSIAAPAYAKGFIKLYAEYLGLDPKPLIADYITTYMPKDRSPLFKEDPTRILPEEKKSLEGREKKGFKFPALKLPKLDIPWDKFQAYAPYVAAGIAVLALLLVGIRLIGRAVSHDHPPGVRAAEQGPSLLMQEPPEPYIDLYE